LRALFGALKVRSSGPVALARFFTGLGSVLVAMSATWAVRLLLRIDPGSDAIFWSVACGAVVAVAYVFALDPIVARLPERHVKVVVALELAVTLVVGLALARVVHATSPRTGPSTGHAAPPPGRLKPLQAASPFLAAPQPAACDAPAASAPANDPHCRAVDPAVKASRGRG